MRLKPQPPPQLEDQLLDHSITDLLELEPEEVPRIRAMLTQFQKLLAVEQGCRDVSSKIQREVGGGPGWNCVFVGKLEPALREV